jgi:thymidylate kinase
VNASCVTFGPPVKIELPRVQKIIVFEGPDGCGKTNIAQGLSADLKIPYFRMPTQEENWRRGGTSFRDALRYDQTWNAEFLRQTRCSVILDRAWPSEFVYSKVYKRETDEETLRKVDEAMARLGTQVVIPLRHDYSKVREDDLVARELLPVIHDRYQDFAEWTRCACILIYVDGYEKNLLEELRLIKNELELNWAFPHPMKTIITLDRQERRFGVKKP